MYKNEYITLPEGKICFYAWEAENPFCVLQLCNGLIEHLGRYDEFASALAAAGITVCGTDHPGHGKSDGTRGHFSDKNGWDYLISANLACAKKIREDYPDLPKALMGHSMGSFIARYIAAYFPDTASAYIFMGTAGRNPVLFAGKTLAAVRSVFGHRRRPDKVINNLCFGALKIRELLLTGFPPTKRKSINISKTKTAVFRLPPPALPLFSTVSARFRAKNGRKN